METHHRREKISHLGSAMRVTLFVLELAFARVGGRGVMGIFRLLAYFFPFLDAFLSRPGEKAVSFAVKVLKRAAGGLAGAPAG